MRPRSPFENLESRRLFSGVPTVSIGDLSIVEDNTGAATADLVVTLSHSRPKQAVTVSYATRNGTAVAGTDYLAASGKLTFGAGETSKTISIPVVGDRVAEQHETFFVGLQGAKNAKIADGQGMVEIIDDEPRIVIYGASTAEGNSATTPLAFTVYLLTPYDEPVSVGYATADGSATAGSDYAASAGVVTFQPGETAVTIPVTVHGDRLVEPDETLSVNLSNPSGFAEIVTGSAVGTVLDDDASLISIADASFDEGATSITFTVSLSAPAEQTVTVDFATADGTALAGVDYVATAGTLTFNPGDTTRTITVQALDTTSADEFFEIHLGGASANAPVADGLAYGYWYYVHPDSGYGWDYGWYDYGYYYY